MGVLVSKKFASGLQAHRSADNCLASCLCNVATRNFSVNKLAGVFIRHKIKKVTMRRKSRAIRGWD